MVANSPSCWTRSGSSGAQRRAIVVVRRARVDADALAAARWVDRRVLERASSTARAAGAAAGRSQRFARPTCRRTRRRTGRRRPARRAPRRSSRRCAGIGASTRRVRAARSGGCPRGRRAGWPRTPSTSGAPGGARRHADDGDAGPFAALAPPRRAAPASIPWRRDTAAMPAVVGAVVHVGDRDASDAERLQSRDEAQHEQRTRAEIEQVVIVADARAHRARPATRSRHLERVVRVGADSVCGSRQVMRRSILPLGVVGQASSVT